MKLSELEALCKEWKVPCVDGDRGNRDADNPTINFSPLWKVPTDDGPAAIKLGPGMVLWPHNDELDAVLLVHLRRCSVEQAKNAYAKALLVSSPEEIDAVWWFRK